MKDSEFPAFFGEAQNCIEPGRFFGGKIVVSKCNRRHSGAPIA
jgi:hypothetical protein